MKKLALILLMAAIVALVSCSSGGETPAATTPAQGQATDLSEYKRLTGSEVAVAIEIALYQPDKIIIAKGTKVTWTNKDFVPHTVTSEKFNSGDLFNGDTYSYTFSETGTYNYGCTVHPQMKGSIVVE